MATVSIAVACIALLVRVTLTCTKIMFTYEKIMVELEIYKK
jgi:hypothetical protein